MKKAKQVNWSYKVYNKSNPPPITNNKKVYEIEKEIADLEEKIKSLREEIAPNCFIVCPKCEVKNSIKKWTWIESWWYEEAYGCTGGDRWRPGNGFYWRCPECNIDLRAYQPDKNKNWDYWKYKFGSILRYKEGY